MATEKNKASISDFEVDSQELHLQSKIKWLRIIDSSRTGLTVLALLMGITALGLGADAVRAYNTTSVSGDFNLALWPDQFNLQPTVSVVIGSTLITLANIVSVVFSNVTVLRNKIPVHTSITFAAPFVAFVASVVSIVFFYVINASDSVDSLLSWSCRWQSLSMQQTPHWGTLCQQSYAGLYLSIVLIPVEAAVLALAGWEMKVERHVSAYSQARGKRSPIGGESS